MWSEWALKKPRLVRDALYVSQQPTKPLFFCFPWASNPRPFVKQTAHAESETARSSRPKGGSSSSTAPRGWRIFVFVLFVLGLLSSFSVAVRSSLRDFDSTKLSSLVLAWCYGCFSQLTVLHDRGDCSLVSVSMHVRLCLLTVDYARLDSTVDWSRS